MEYWDKNAIDAILKPIRELIKFDTIMKGTYDYFPKLHFFNALTEVDLNAH